MTPSLRALITAGGAVLTVCALSSAPTAHATGMRVGNYEVLTDRWNDHSWIWSITHSCGTPDCGTWLVDPVANPATDTLNAIAVARPPKSRSFQQSVFFAEGMYVMTVDVPDGVRCIGYNLPSHDVYSWDAVSLAGIVDSTYEAGCYGAPGGTATYNFSLRRF